MVANKVCFHAVATVTSMADMRRWVQPIVATPLICEDEEVSDGNVTDLVYISAEGRALGAMESRPKHFVDLAGLGPQEQDRRSADRILAGRLCSVSKA
jgi:hypothetical protein